MFVSEDYAFAEIEQNEEINLTKIQQQFFFYHLFDSIYPSTYQQQQDISKLKGKYAPFISLTDLQINEYLE